MQQCVNCLPSLLHFPLVLLHDVPALALTLARSTSCSPYPSAFGTTSLSTSLSTSHSAFCSTHFLSFRHLSRILCFSSPLLATRYWLYSLLYLHIASVYLVFLISDFTLLLYPLPSFCSLLPTSSCSNDTEFAFLLIPSLSFFTDHTQPNRTQPDRTLPDHTLPFYFLFPLSISPLLSSLPLVYPVALNFRTTQVRYPLTH